MPSIDLSYVNIAMDLLSLVVVLIIFSACLGEWISKNTGSKRCLFLLGFVIIALVGDIVSWIGEGHPEYSMMTLIANTLTSCAGQLAMICFMEYLCFNLYQNSKAASVTLNIFRLFCSLSLMYSVGNAFFGYSFTVSPTGHYVHSENTIMVVFHLLFSIMSFFVLILMALFATSSRKSSRVAFIIYTLFPMAGIIVDYTFHGFSLTYVGIVISVMVIYTDIYLQKQRLIDDQRNALMLSQINPHFTYNTLSAIAAMCDINPKLAKSLTIDFSKYLRQNIDCMTSDQLISFDREIEHVECYLKIEKARFREKLNVIYSVSCRDFSLPPLTVQPIVENAVKHGITKKAEGGTIKISTYCTEDDYIIEVIDDGVGFDENSTDNSSDRRHVGLENVKSRVQRMCRGTVDIKSTVGFGSRVTITIPRLGRR